MYAGQDFTDAAPTEAENYSFDFTATVGDVANTPTVVNFSLTVVSGQDTSVASRLGGDGTHHTVALSGFKATTKLTGLLAGVKYRLTAVATLTDGQAKELYSFVTGEQPGV